MSFTKIQTFTVIECCNCGIAFGVSDEFDQRKREDHSSFYCPAGHSQHYTAKSESEKLKEELDWERKRRERAEQAATHESQRRQNAERRRAAAKGQVTRIKNRISKGVCPCCNRTFQNLGRHMASQHPEYTKD